MRGLAANKNRGSRNVKIRRGRRRWASMAAAAVVLAGLGGAAPSFAMFDDDHQTKLQGTVTHYQWTNPHVYIELETMETDGSTKRWTIECANPGILDRVGWKFNMIKVGDKLKMVVA